MVVATHKVEGNDLVYMLLEHVDDKIRELITALD
jgi:hypothetical protein